MTQKSFLALEPCKVCGSSNFDQTVLGNRLEDASDFTNNDEEQSPFRYELVTCPNCGHSSIQTDNPCWMPTRKHKFIEFLKSSLNSKSIISYHDSETNCYFIDNALAISLGYQAPTVQGALEYYAIESGWL